MKTKKRKKIFEFYIMLAAGLSICLVIAACIKQPPLKNKAADEFAALSADFTKLQKQYNDLLNEHNGMIEAHGREMADQSDSAHLGLENMHVTLLSGHHDVITRHQLNLQMKADLPSLRKDVHVDESQMETDLGLLLKSHDELRKDFEKMFDDMKTIRADHNKMLIAHQVK